jgi:DNA-binding NtrC family response regulator
MNGIEQRLLVVDDDPLIREELESLFAAQPYQVECVASVTDAMQRLAAREFALALVDVRIGGGDGIALTKDVREHWPDVDVIMITGYGSIKNAVEAMRQGAVDYITKPFQPEELLHAVRRRSSGAADRRDRVPPRAALRPLRVRQHGEPRTGDAGDLRHPGDAGAQRRHRA